jgi:nitric oxide reductase activation protein
VRYLHIKGFSESWDDVPKARLAAMEPGYSTRTGAALRHAAHYLGARQSEKKLMLVITDGEPSDVDSPDGQWLVQDARKAVQELQAEGIYTWCINLDAKSDDTVREVYGSRYTIVNHLEKLPSSLAQLFLSLTAH